METHRLGQLADLVVAFLEIEYAGELLMRACTSGKAKDVEEATMQIRRALKVEGWMRVVIPVTDTLNSQRGQ